MTDRAEALRGGAPAGRRGPRPEPVVLLVHLCAAVAVLATAAMGRLPFVPAYDAVTSRPTWLGLATSWVLVALVYVIAWYAVSRASRAAEVGLFSALLVASLWAAGVVVISLSQTFGVGADEFRFTAVWWLRLLTAVATLGGLVATVRSRAITWDDDGMGTPYGRNDGIPLPALPRRFVLGVAAVTAVGLLVCAFQLALVARPTATPEEAVAATTAAVRDVPAEGLLAFQAGVSRAIDTQARTRPRDRWAELDGLVAGGDVYSDELWWPTQVSYRDQLVCVASAVEQKRVTVLAGPCPR